MVTRPSRRSFLAAGLGTAVAARLGGSHALGELVTHAAGTKPAGRDIEAIEHVIVVMQENRSFDHYYGVYPGVRGFDDRSETVSVFSQASPEGRVLPFRLDFGTTQPMCAGSSDTPIHDWAPQHQSWNDGKMDAFVEVHSRRAYDGPEQGPLVMGYFTREDLPFYYSLADAFTICDAYHCSVIGPTMPNRLYSLSATIDPSGKDGGPVVETPGFHNSHEAVGSVRWETMFERLQDDGVSWKFYQAPGTSVGPGQSLSLSDGFNAFLYFEQYLEDPASELYQRAFLPVWPDEFVGDIANDTLPQVSWILPPLVDSEHASAAPVNGERLVATVLSALTAKPELWAKTVVFLMYDENGGFFDHVKPPTPPAGTEGEFLARPLPADAAGIAGPIGLGFRVPCLVISPFSTGGHINSDVFDHTSLLRFLETRFGTKIPNLTAWRRETVGDLTSTLDLKHPDTFLPLLAPLGSSAARLDKECPANQEEASLLSPPPAIRVPEIQRVPRQERKKPSST